MKYFKFLPFYMGVLLGFISFFSLFLGVKFYFKSLVYFVEWEILEFNSSSLIMTLLFDWMSLSFMGLVLLISSVVMFYSTFYMEGDKFLTRFIFLVYLFVVSMIFLILSPNFISILLGWDGLGLVSYCLVIYYQNVKSANAGMITILSNRIGDVAILLGIAWLLNFGSWNFFYLQYMYSNFDTLILGGLVILAAMTKSAQMPFSAWLPAAMAAPTPVSALVHSSTLVTAGVYLLIRFSFMLNINNFLFYVGVFTMFMSGLGANFEMDLKKIIALSTLSQLGLMIMTLSFGFYEFSFFHLMTHAMFKSLLFLCAGVFIHSMGDTQDIRSMGGLMISCPVVSLYFIIASMALCGFPFLSGFYSKDMILEMMISSQLNSFMLIVVFLATMFTLTYSVRLTYFVFFNNLGSKASLSMGEAFGMTFPITFLVLISIMFGSWLSVNLFPVNFIFLPYFSKMMIILGLVLFLGVSIYFLFSNNFFFTLFSSAKENFLGSMWFMPLLSSMFFMPLLKFGSNLFKFSDHGWSEYVGGQGSIKVLNSYSSRLDILNLVNLKFFMFLFFMMVGLVVIFMI